MASSTTIYFIRHGHSTANGRGILAGRDNSIKLSAQGREEAQHLANRLANEKFDQLLSSPIARCLETIEPIRKTYRSQRKPPAFSRDNSFVEMDYGKWSGKKLALLSKKSEWSQIQNQPSSFIFPSGEGFLDASHRISERLLELSTVGGRILICSHGDIIKLALAQALGIHLDHFQRIAISPASISAISYAHGNPQVLFMNDTSHLPNVRERGKSARALGGGA